MGSGTGANLFDLYHMLDEFLQQLPEPLRKKVGEALRELKNIIVDSRQPRLVVVGRRGAGKSSLINAILGEERLPVGDVKAQTGRCRWETLSNARGDLRILDTRGFAESSRPVEETDAATPLDEILLAIKEERPDAILFLCKASEVGAHLDADVAALQTLRTAIEKQYSYIAPVIGVVTKIDELAPGAGTLNLEHPKKKANVAETAAILKSKLPSDFGKEVRVFPVSTYLEFEGGVITHDRRSGLADLVHFLLDVLPEDTLLQMARAAQFKDVQHKVAMRLVKIAATLCAAIGASPIPLADMPFITGVQMSMITGIAYVSGRRLDKQGVAEFLGAMGLNAGLAFAAREVARAAVRVFFPGVGSVVSGAVASASTIALGRAAVAYFIDKQPIEVAKESLKHARDEVAAAQNE